MSANIPLSLRNRVSGAAFKTNPYRMLLARYLLNNGGYAVYPISYNVSLSNVDTDWDTAIANVRKFEHVQPDALRSRAIMAEAQEDFDETTLWNWATESMASTLSDTSCYSSYSPATAKRFAFPHGPGKRILQRRRTTTCYPAGKTSLGTEVVFDGYADEQYEAKFELHGRGGKHLVITHFEGVALANQSSAALAEELLRHDSFANGGKSNDWCRKLAGMIEEWDTSFSRASVEREFEYQYSYYLGQAISDLYETRQSKVNLGRFARRVRNTLPQRASAYNW